MGMPLKESVLQARRLPRSDDLLMERARLLQRDDRELIEAIFIRGQTTKSLARMMGMDMRTLRERVKRLTRRLASRKFLDAARSLPHLDAADAELARMRFCEGFKLRQLREHFNVTDHNLRRWLDHVWAQVSIIGRLSKQTPDRAAEAYQRYWDRRVQGT